MIKFRFCLILVMFLGLQGILFAGAFPYKGMIRGDYVRMRTAPSTDGKHIAFLYKFTTVEVLEESKTDNPWYKIRYGNLEGWTSAKFVNRASATQIDPYDASGDMQWYYKRYGHSTWYTQSKLNVKSFTLDEYRNLMKAAEKGNMNAWYALKNTVYKHLNQKPNDPAYQHLKKKLYSRAFIVTSIKAADPNDFNSLSHVPRTLMNDQDFILMLVINRPDIYNRLPVIWKNNRTILVAALTKSPRIIYNLPQQFRKDKQIILYGLSLIKRCYGRTLRSRIAPQLLKDQEVLEALSRCGN